jgi:hypothetical protein
LAAQHQEQDCPEGADVVGGLGLRVRAAVGVGRMKKHRRYLEFHRAVCRVEPDAFRPQAAVGESVFMKRVEHPGQLACEWRGLIPGQSGRLDPFLLGPASFFESGGARRLRVIRDQENPVSVLSQFAHLGHLFEMREGAQLGQGVLPGGEDPGGSGCFFEQDQMQNDMFPLLVIVSPPAWVDSKARS